MEWAYEEGWNPGIHDAECYQLADPQGCIVGLSGENPIAFIAAMKYGKYGFIGPSIVGASYRGQGYGLQLWDTALEYLKDCHLIESNSILEQQGNYDKAGFQRIYNNISYEGMGGGKAPQNDNIVPLASLPHKSIEEYTLPFFPARRRRFHRAWMVQSNSVSLGILEQDKLAGYCLARRCMNGYKVGPLLADTPDLADQLFVALLAELPDQEIYLDAPGNNPVSHELAERHNLKSVMETAHMYKGTLQTLPFDRQFCLTSLDLG